MNDNILQEFSYKARDIIKGFDLSEEEKTLILETVNALMRNDADRLEVLLVPVDDEMKLNVLRTATMIIDSLRIESENEIIEAGDVVQLERLAELAEKEDKVFAKVFTQILDEYNAKKGPKATTPTPPPAVS